jgi:hypothetical protein
MMAAMHQRDEAARAAYEAQWRRYQHKVEQARREWMEERTAGRI